jgi:hypothetical protein
LRKRCWTVDRRLRRGLVTHIMCPLCGTAHKTLDHISLQCPFARDIWTGVVMRLGLPDIRPSGQAVLEEWWPVATACFIHNNREATNSLVMLVLRSLWMERNARVLDRSRSTAQATLRLVLSEWSLECLGCM